MSPRSRGLVPIEWSDLYASWGLTPSALEHAYAPSRVLEVLSTFLPRIPGGRVLELGSAPGRWLAWVGARVGLDPLGVDLNVSGTRLSRRLYPAVPVARADVMRLPFPDACFDAVYSIGLLEHFEDPVPVLREAHRVLSKTGVCVTVMPNLAAGTFHRWHWERFQPLFLAGHRPYDLDELKAVIAEAGFVVTHAEYNGLYAPHLQRVMGRLPLRWLLRRLETPRICANLVVVSRAAMRAPALHD